MTEDDYFTIFALAMALEEIEDGNISREHETNVRAALRIMLGTNCPVEYEKRMKRIWQLVREGKLREHHASDEFYTTVLSCAKALAERRKAS